MSVEITKNLQLMKETISNTWTDFYYQVTDSLTKQQIQQMTKAHI